MRSPMSHRQSGVRRIRDSRHGLCVQQTVREGFELGNEAYVVDADECRAGIEHEGMAHGRGRIAVFGTLNGADGAEKPFAGDAEHERNA